MGAREGAVWRVLDGCYATGGWSMYDVRRSWRSGMAVKLDFDIVTGVYT